VKIQPQWVVTPGKQTNIQQTSSVTAKMSPQPGLEVANT